MIEQVPKQDQTSEPGGASSRGSHRIAQISECERAWYLSWVRRLQSKRAAPALTEGSAVHMALAYWWANRMSPKPAWLDKPLADRLAKITRGMPEAATLALQVRDAYDRFYGATEKWEPHSVEQEYRATVGSLFGPSHHHAKNSEFDKEIVSARIDLMVRVNGKLWAVDHKTTKGSDGRSYANLPRWKAEGEFAHSFQFVLQTLILRQVFGAEFGGILVQRIKTSSPFDFDRNVVHLSPQILHDAPWAVYEQVAREARLGTQIRETAQLGVDMDAWLPRGNFWSCWSWGRSCQFRELCEAEPQQRQEIVQLGYELRE